MGYGFGTAVVLKGSHMSNLKSDECANHTRDSFRLQISVFFFRHFLNLLNLCLTVFGLHRDTMCPLSDSCISNLNIAYISYKRFATTFSARINAKNAFQCSIENSKSGRVLVFHGLLCVCRIQPFWTLLFHKAFWLECCFLAISPSTVVAD